ncbi:MAG: hypothetical protein ACRDK2_05205 [Solirubrobacteraceae bacterium]
MATASNTSPRKTTTAAAKRTTAARRTSARATQTKATQAKAARTRAAHQTESAAKQAQTATRETVGVLGDYAERAILIPVGAALVARDRVASSVGDVISTYSTPSKAQSKAQAQLRHFERRGSTARNRLEREVRKTRTRLERELRQRRREIEAHRNSLTKNLSKQVEQTQTQIEGAVRSRLEEGADLAGRIQERVLHLI